MAGAWDSPRALGSASVSELSSASIRDPSRLWVTPWIFLWVPDSWSLARNPVSATLRRPGVACMEVFAPGGSYFWQLLLLYSL